MNNKERPYVSKRGAIRKAYIYLLDLLGDVKSAIYLIFNQKLLFKKTLFEIYGNDKLFLGDRHNWRQTQESAAGVRNP